jgi:hypothetical protein
MPSSLRNINNLEKFQDFIGNNPAMEYIRGKGRKFKHSYSLNQISYQFKKCIPKNPTESDKALIQNIKTKLHDLDRQSLTSLAVKGKVSRCALSCAKFRQNLGNWWFKATTGFDRKKFLTADRPGPTVARLMDQFTEAWNPKTEEFHFPDFDLDQFTELLSRHADQFKKTGIHSKHHFGFIEKFDLNPAENPQIFVRADLHGDLKSLIEDIRTLQEEGHLDKNFKCKPGVHLQFLGDYVDRGEYGTQIIKMLALLKEENPSQVHLIRGNHEDPTLSLQYCATDPYLTETQLNKKSRAALERFYQTMPLTTYISVNGEEKREYVQYTHGTFEPTMDPAPLLDRGRSGDYMPVPKQRKISERITRLAQGNSELAETAKRIVKIAKQSGHLEPDLTVYNWGDVTHEETELEYLSDRKYCLSGKDIRHYLDLSSEQHRVMMLFRGHQHYFQHLKDDKGQIVATTLPVGMDCPAYRNAFDQPDRAYIITPKGKVADWTKRALLRESGHDRIDEVTEAYPLTSGAV